MPGKTIQIFLPDGNPRGVRIAAFTTRAVQATLVPRAHMDVASARGELKQVGVYFLVGPGDADTQQVYVGEAENCLDRLKQHNKAKDFWTTAIAVTSKTHHFTKTHGKYLEAYCHSAAAQAERFELENATVPTKPHASESMEADLHDDFDTLRTLVATLGYPLFDPIKTVKPRGGTLTCKGKSASAKGEYTEDGLVVFAGSTANIKLTKTAGTWVENMHDRLLEGKVMERDGGVYRFRRDHLFSSPSAAAAAVLARRANGWIEWKYEDGRTLDEVKRKG
jgi:hypothetical protein